MVILFGEKEQSDGEKTSGGGDLDSDLPGSLLDGEGKKDDARLVEEALSNNVGSFTPDMFIEQVSNYRNAKRLYGDRLLKLFTGYAPDYLEKNITIPEFKKHLLEELRERVKKLQSDGILDDQGTITDKGEELAALNAYVEELDSLQAKGFQGTVEQKKHQHYGERQESRAFKSGDRYRDVNVKDSVRTAIKRGRKEIEREDLRVSPRREKGAVMIVYGLDASASMRGEKLLLGKRAGIALAAKALARKDKVGLVVFSHDARTIVEPSLDLPNIITSLIKARSSRETDYGALFTNALALYPKGAMMTKHLILLTDALPTAGENPVEEALTKAELLRNAGITISIIGIQLDTQGKDLARKIVDIGGGRLYLLNNASNADAIILQEYEETRAVHDSSF